jgi:glycosyltransferase involved in cell wall biosynthesis
MIKVTALTSGKHFPSSRFRVRQFIEPLKSFGIDVSEHYPLLNKYHTKWLPPLSVLARLPGLLAARSSAVTWLEREMIPGRFTLERFAGSKRLLDVDDAIWLNAPHFSERLARSCDGVIAGNQFIADYYQKIAARVWTIPTSIDTAKWRPAPPAERDKWTIGWTGTSSNLKYLNLIEEPLADFLAQHRQSRLLVVCDRKPTLKRLPAQSWRFVRWSPENEVGLVQSMDIGLMPLPDAEWARGKCALKMIMYLAVGIPAIVSPIGVSKELLGQGDVALAARNENEWSEALCRLFQDRALSTAIGAAGRKLVMEQFSVNKNVSRLAEVIREVADSRKSG